MGIRRGLTTDIGATGFEHRSFGYSRQDFLSEWIGATKIKNIAEMIHNSPTIGALRLSLEMPIRDIDWQFVGPEGVDEETDPGLLILNDSMDAMSHSWNDHIIDALLFPFYGWSMFTITYQNDGGRMLWKKFKMLGHDTVHRWLFDPVDGGLAGVQQSPHLWPDPIPIERMLIYRFRKTKNDPEGESVLRPAYIPWYFTKHIQELEAIGVERNLAGMPVITPPAGADMTESDSESTDYGRAHAIVRNVRNDEQGGVVLPPPTAEGDHNSWHFELVTAGGMSKVIDTNMIISRYEKRMLMAALSQFLMLGMDNIGALATFEGATDFHAMLLNSVSDIIAETFSKFAIPRLLVLNGIDPDGYALIHSPAGDIDLPGFADILAKAGTFLTWTPEDEVDLRSRMRMPEKTVEELEELQEEERERNAEIAAQFQPSQGEEQEDFGTEYYAADNAPDDDERKRLERQWFKRMVDYGSDALKRVQKGAKGLAS
jgi:hypothetical protein